MAASTWGDMFSNLYWNIGINSFTDDVGGEYRTGKGKNVYYILNGEFIINPANLSVESEDRLLVWYGSGSQDLVKERYFPLVASNARAYNNELDPASCSANQQSALW
jgi:hypothetical protein